MANLNKFFLIGRLVRDPEFKEVSSGSVVANMSFATTRYFRNKDGDRKEETLFIDAVAWNKQAEVVRRFMVKGQEVHVEGHLELDQWESTHVCGKCKHEEFTRKSKHRIVIDSIQYIGQLKKEDEEEFYSYNDDEEDDEGDDDRFRRTYRKRERR